MAYSFLTETVELIGGIGTDFDPFAEDQVAGFHLAYLRGSPIYHTFEDSVENVAMGSVQQHGSYAVSMSRHFGDEDLNAPRDDAELVFFSLGRSLIVRYPAGWSVPLSILTAVTFAVALAVRPRRNWGVLRSLLVGFAMVLTGIVAAVLACTVVWSLFSRVRQTPGVAESYVYLFVLLGLGCGAGGLVWRAARDRWRDLDAAASVLAVWLVVGIATSVWMRGAGYLFIWPALAGSFALMWLPASRIARLIRLIMVAGPALLLVTPAVDTFFQLASPRPGNPDSEVVEAVAVVVLLAVLVVGLIASMGQSRSKPGVA